MRDMRVVSKRRRRSGHERGTEVLHDGGVDDGGVWLGGPTKGSDKATCPAMSPTCLPASAELGKSESTENSICEPFALVIRVFWYGAMNN